MASLKRSASSACSISGIWSLLEPSGILAGMSNRCAPIQSGPLSWYGLILNAIRMRSDKDKLPMSTRPLFTFTPMCILPGMIFAGSSGGAGLIAATSNVSGAGDVCAGGDTGVCAGNRPLAKIAVAANTPSNLLYMILYFRILPARQRIRVHGYFHKRALTHIRRLYGNSQPSLVPVGVAQEDRVRRELICPLTARTLEYRVAGRDIAAADSRNNPLIDKPAVAGKADEFAREILAGSGIGASPYSFDRLRTEFGEIALQCVLAIADLQSGGRAHCHLTIGAAVGQDRDLVAVELIDAAGDWISSALARPVECRQSGLRQSLINRAIREKREVVGDGALLHYTQHRHIVEFVAGIDTLQPVRGRHRGRGVRLRAGGRRRCGGRLVRRGSICVSQIGKRPRRDELLDRRPVALKQSLVWRHEYQNLEASANAGRHVVAPRPRTVGRLHLGRGGQQVHAFGTLPALHLARREDAQRSVHVDVAIEGGAKIARQGTAREHHYHHVGRLVARAEDCGDTGIGAGPSGRDPENLVSGPCRVL